MDRSFSCVLEELAIELIRESSEIGLGIDLEFLADGFVVFLELPHVALHSYIVEEMTLYLGELIPLFAPVRPNYH